MLKVGEGRSVGAGPWRAGVHRYREGLSFWARSPFAVVRRELPSKEWGEVCVGVWPAASSHGPFLRVRLCRYWLGFRVIRYRRVASHVWVGWFAVSLVWGWR